MMRNRTDERNGRTSLCAGRKTVAIALMLALILGVAALISGCGSTAEDKSLGSGGESTEAAGDVPAEDAGAFDLCANLEAKTSGDVRTIETDHFVIELPYCDTWTYDYDDMRLNIYNKACYDINGAGDGPNGMQVTISAVEKGDDWYRQWGQYFELGEDDQYVYAANFPTDVRWIMDDPQIEKDYRALDDLLRADSSWIRMK